jgi:S-DNA-T family DNA segregation ATPase FtsK/SpoIIIE
MPHLLIAGATGTGKSVALNAMICSLLYKAKPDEVKLIMVDPKRIELSSYDGIPHLITPVVTDAKKATNALYWAVREMERRYERLSEVRSRNIKQYNQKIETEKPAAGDPPAKLPYIVIIIDELADLMMVASRDVEVALTRLAQMARAAGIHLILATQRPSVDVLTGIIKANFPTRLTFQVSSKTDSRTIIDANGAESLLGSGDMLFLPPGTAKLQRIHGAYLSEAELTQIIEFLRRQEKPEYDQQITEAQAAESANGEDEDGYDERYDDAVELVVRTRQASISMVQRHLRIGYNRAARIIEKMEREGVVGPSDGVKQREVLVSSFERQDTGAAKLKGPKPEAGG